MNKHDHVNDSMTEPAGEPMPQPPKARKEVDIPEVYQVVVECGDERRQREVYEQMTAAGFRCRLMLL